MTFETRWLRVRDLFEGAVERDPSTVTAWLDTQPDVDAPMRAEVLSLLDHHSRAGSFLAEPTSGRLAALLVEDLAFEPGHTLGPYTIVNELGRGGMGRVYLAKDARLGRMVALKALSPELTANPSHRDRLRREARAAAALTHSGICTVYALEEFGDELYIAAEVVDGRTLREEIDSGRLPSGGDVQRTAAELAAALAHAHAHGVTHRDLKPDNVMRTREGRLKILDFGLARFEPPNSPDDGTTTRLEERLTQHGAIIGTPRYMAPEQLNGQPAGARADVFAFGVLLYEYATGVHPFDGATPLAVAARILEGKPKPIDERRPDLSPALVGVIERSMRKAEADRFASAADIPSALENAAAPRPTGSMAGWWRTHQLVVTALYFLACGLTWQIKEWLPGAATVVFVVTGITATVAGVFRGHMLFTERINSAGLAAERRRAMPITLATDLLLAAALGADGLVLSAVRPVPGLLTIALGVGIALARLIVEPATTSASFGTAEPRQSPP